MVYHISNPLGDVTNLAGPAAGEITVDRSGGAVQAGRIEVDLRKLATGIGMRDHHVKSSTILDVEKYPTATLVLDAVEGGAASTAGAGAKAPAPADQKAAARGKLTLHGATHEVTIPVDLRWHGDRLRAIGTFTLALADYGIPRPRRLFIVAGKTVDVHVDLLFGPGGDRAAAGANP